MQNFKIKPDLTALSTISAFATKFVYALNPTETVDDLPANFVGKISIKSLERVFTRETSNKDYYQGSVLVTAVFAGENKERKVWVPIPVFAAICIKDCPVEVRDGKPYTDSKTNKTVTRAQLYAPGVEISPSEVILFSSSLMAMATSQVAAPPAPATV